MAFAEEVGNDLEDARSQEIDFETYKKEFEAELAQKINLERQQGRDLTEARLAKAKGHQYNLDENQIISWIQIIYEEQDLNLYS